MCVTQIWNIDDLFFSSTHLSLFVQKMELHEMCKLNYLDSCISPGGRTSDEVFSRIPNMRLAPTYLGHMWRQRDTRLSIEDRACTTAVRSRE